MLLHTVQSTHRPCCFAKGGRKRKLILSGLQPLSGLLHIFRSCPGKWCLRVRPIKDATWTRMRFRGRGCCSYPCAITVPVLLAKACSHSVSLICVSGGGSSPYSTPVRSPSSSLWQRAAPGCATAMAGARWTRTAGTVSASQAGEERAATWPWRPSARTARTTKEVGDAGLRARGCGARAHKARWVCSYLSPQQSRTPAGKMD